MNLTFVASELSKWDSLPPGGTLVLPFFADERPLRGPAGLCDWRMCGRLSHLLGSDRLTGAWGESTLFPVADRLPFMRLLLLGLGPSGEFDEARAVGAARLILDKTEKLGLSSFALVPPGRSTGNLSARRALELFLSVVEAAPSGAARARRGAQRVAGQESVETAAAGADRATAVSSPSVLAELLVIESVAGQKEAAELTRQRG